MAGCSQGHSHGCRPPRAGRWQLLSALSQWFVVLLGRSEPRLNPHWPERRAVWSPALRCQPRVISHVPSLRGSIPQAPPWASAVWTPAPASSWADCSFPGGKLRGPLGCPDWFQLTLLPTCFFLGSPFPTSEHLLFSSHTGLSPSQKCPVISWLQAFTDAMSSAQKTLPSVRVEVPSKPALRTPPSLIPQAAPGGPLALLASVCGPWSHAGPFGESL